MAEHTHIPMAQLGAVELRHVAPHPHHRDKEKIPCKGDFAFIFDLSSPNASHLQSPQQMQQTYKQ